MSPTLGGSVDRVDGRRKVTGAAQYAADYTFERLAYAVPVLSKTGKGRVKSIDSAAAREPGVLAVLTRDNCPKLSHTANDFGSWTKLGEARLPFEDDEIHYAGQVLAVVIADSLEQATAAAMRMKIEVDEQPPAIHVEESMGAMYVPKGMGFAPIDCSRGDVAAGATGAAFSIDAQYSTPAEHHNPMEPAATTAVWTDGDLTLYDATQWVMGARNAVADVLGLDRERVRIVSQFVGGGFGCKGFTWPHQVLAAVAARMVNRPVKLALSRQMMYTGCGHRPQTQQHVALAADADGRLRAIRHDTINSTSTVDEFVESCGVITPFLYECPNIAVTHRVVPINIATPTPMRAPGENPGLFALECALDELAFNAGIDPVELRIRNHADRDPEKNLPWSSKYLKECYARGREKSGWDRRNPKPGSMKENGSLIGYGMATATYPGYRMQGAAVVRLHDDGTVSVGSATQDIGGGTYTIMALVAADALGVPLDSIRPALGDSRLPPAPVSGGSMTTASVGPAVQVAAENVVRKLAEMAVQNEASAFHGRKPDEIQAIGGKLATTDGRVARSFAETLQSMKLARVEADAKVQPGEEAGKYSFHSFGAQFAQVRVDPDLGVVRVARMVSVFDVGRVMNLKTARSQALGGIIQGIGMALMEETRFDPRTAAIVTDNLADYLAPVNADVREIDVEFINLPDPYISPLGARGVGELAVTGVAPAIANAVFHATGKRVRDLPITIEKLIA